MRVGSHPAKDQGALESFGPHRVVVPVHVPTLDGYFAEAREVLARCLESLRLTAAGRVAVTLVDDGSCPEVLEDLRACQDAGWVDQLVVNRPNRGKVDSVLGVARASFEPLVTITDADILFRAGWVEAVEELFAIFPECGFASLFPSPPGAFHLTSATLLGALARRELTVDSLVDEADLDRFAASIGRPDLFPEMWRRHQLVVRRGDVTACVGAPHWVLTLRREVLAATPPEPSRRAVGGSETRWLDEPADRLGRWRLTTSRAYAQHMGNVVEPWMDAELDRVRAAVAAGVAEHPGRSIAATGRSPLVSRLPWALRARVIERVVRPLLERRVRRAGARMDGGLGEAAGVGAGTGMEVGGAASVGVGDGTEVGDDVRA